ncbi:MAG: substrate-binding domain-containing protein [Planctomycetes bacterium]|nr:substrate-binding domain-containing protein [Planctomycetota bacterium]
MDRPDRADTVLRSLLREMACGRWPSGSRLPPVRQLETEFVTSRLTMLEVLHRAEAADLLTVQPRQGATVRPAAAERAAKMLAVRRAASHGRRMAVLIPDYFPKELVPYYWEFAQTIVDDAVPQDIAGEIVEIPILDQVAFAAEFAARGFAAAVVLGYVPSYLVSLHILKQQRFPVLLINREPQSLALPWLNQDEAGAVHGILAKLTAMGHRNLCLVRRPLDLDLLQRVTREKTWVRTLRRAGLIEHCTLPLHYVPFADMSLTMGGLLDHPRRPTALVFENGDLCERFLRSPRYRHLKIPRDLSVATFDRIHEDGWLVDCPPVTTIEPDRHAMTSAILQRVNEMFNGNPEPENGHVPMRIRMTDSIAPLGR